MKWKKTLGALLVCLMVLPLLASCKAELPETFVSDDRCFVPCREQTDFVCIEMDTGKRIVLELYPDQAPITVDNFKKLVAKGFYDGLTFHRISSNFVIQGGDPDGNGGGGPGYTIKGEFLANGVSNTVKHERGVLSMARATDYNTAGSQFFICLNTPVCSQLDGKYAAFGKVLAGMDVVDEIASVRVSGETPLNPPVMKRLFFVKPEEEASETTTPTQTAEQFEREDLSAYTKSETPTDFVCIEMADGWKTVVELYPDQAPITVANFKKLVGEKLYDGVSFHRIAKGFVIQGGIPLSGTPTESIKGEFSENGVNNTVKHEKGTISMARATDPDSASSQFFICLSTATCSQLDGKYAAFGKVVGGMSTVERIEAITQTVGETPLNPPVMKAVYFVNPPAQQPPQTQEPPQTTPQTQP